MVAGSVDVDPWTTAAAGVGYGFARLFLTAFQLLGTDSAAISDLAGDMKSF